MLAAVTSALGTVMEWIGDVISSLTSAPVNGVGGGALNALLPLFAIGIAISAFLFAFKAIRKVTWGA